MIIEVDGRNWTVEQRPARALMAGDPAEYCALSFRPEGGGDGEEVEMGWIPRPRTLTPHLANSLFHLAGERLWRSGRGTLYRVVLEDGWSDDDASSGGAMRVRFQPGDAGGTRSTVYDLPCPLGRASRSDLEKLLERAEPGGRDAPAGRPTDVTVSAAD